VLSSDDHLWCTLQIEKRARERGAQEGAARRLRIGPRPKARFKANLSWLLPAALGASSLVTQMQTPLV